MMVGYKAKPNKMVFLLSTAHSKPMVEAIDSKKRRQVVLDYNSKKSDIDTTDQMLCSYSTKCAFCRWPLAAFFNLLDIVALDSYIISKELKIFSNQRQEFLLSLGLFCLCLPELERRSTSHSAFELKTENQTSLSSSLTIVKCRAACGTK